MRVVSSIVLVAFAIYVVFLACKAIQLWNKKQDDYVNYKNRR